jgi:hypothetical protein
MLRKEPPHFTLLVGFHMPKRSRKTLDQSRKEKVYRSQVDLSAQTDPRDTRERYVEAARQLWQLDDDWETRLAIEVFGPEKMGSIAFALDPLARYQAGRKLCAQPTRKRYGPAITFGQHIHWVADFKRYQNYHIENPDLIPEWLAFHESDDTDYNAINPGLDLTMKMHDSVQSQRQAGQEYGLMDRERHEYSSKTFPEISVTEEIKDYQVGTDGQYDRSVNTYVFDFATYKTPFIFPPWGWAGYPGYTDEISQFTSDFASNHLSEVLPQTLANKRLYNAFYQIGELRDLPELIKGTKDFVDFLAGLTKSPDGLRLADKASAGAYLTWLFGYQSIQQAVQSLVEFPNRLAKKVNYLLEKNGKTVPVRAQRVYDDPSLQFFQVKKWLPSMVPIPYVDTSEIVVTDLSTVTLKCSTTQRITYPQVGEPKATGQTLANALGLSPRVVDIYNLIPWTWLVDWFTGLSQYLNLVESVDGDFQIINLGFATVRVDSAFRLTGNLIVNDFRRTISNDGSYVDEYYNPRQVPVDMVFHSTFEKRYNVGDLGSVKCMDPLESLGDPQLSILGALFTTHTK